MATTLPPAAQSKSQVQDISRDLTSLIAEHRPQFAQVARLGLEDFVRRRMGPLAQGGEALRGLQPADKFLRALREGALHQSRFRMPSSQPQVIGPPATSPVVVTLPCIETVYRQAPYDLGLGGAETVTETQPSSGPQLKASSNMSNELTGEIALAVGAGQFSDRVYPAPESWLFGKLADVNAAIVEFYSLSLSPLDRPYMVEVTAEIQLGEPPDYWPETYLAPAEPYGVAGVLGDCFLTVYGAPSLAWPSTVRAKFLEQAQSATGAGGMTYHRVVHLTNRHWLLPGAQVISIVVDARVAALYYTPDEHTGFAGVDFGIPETHRIWPYGMPGGPIRLSQLKITTCPYAKVP